MLLKPTYEIIKPPESALDWDGYKNIIEKEWNDLLNNHNEYEEKDFQSFFERHPCMIPWLYGIIGCGAHGYFPSAIVSQPPLPGLNSKRPDFLFITSDSVSVYVVLIEIEHPLKPWATKKETPSSQLIQAIDQLKEWQVWFSDPLNEEKFKKDYKIPLCFLSSHSFEKKYILIYGKRDDPTLTDSFKRKRAKLAKPDEIIMTYDRLEPQLELKDYLSVKLDKYGYKAIQIPPSLELGPTFAEYWSIIRDKDSAIRTNKYLSQIRKEFLISRWPYWDNWAKTSEHGYIGFGGKE